MKDLKRGFAIWFTGLPCSGKTTLADALTKKLGLLGYPVENLDGDSFRLAYGHALGYSMKDRQKNVSLAAHFASDFIKKSKVVTAAFVSPYRGMRQEARRLMEPHFVEVYVRCPLRVCEERDVKGMYRLAREGKIKRFTGISDPYEEPLAPEIVVDTDRRDIETCATEVMAYLAAHRFIHTPGKTSPRTAARLLDN
ncbi:MAG: adenylyl-sulfate kinase [Candidatus Omnitrophica bacterium]|nr:adenylyl-sulfate kinase [Candidatus Omnitrophota bacterium]